MNKLTKYGVSALCGSLAAISPAIAGDLSVTGGIDMSWMSKESETTGNPIGIGSNISFAGSGELDNGISFALAIDHTNASALSNARVTLTVPSLGDFRIDQGLSGTGLDRFDDKTPNVWEEANGTGLSTGIKTVAGASAGAGVEWTPNMMPDGLTAYLHYTPKADGSGAGDKASKVVNSSIGHGWDIAVEADGSTVLGMDGLTVFAGMSSIEQGTIALDNKTGDRSQYTMGANYAVGSFTIGYQYSRDNLQNRTAGSTSFYENDMYGITFQINDDLSIGYNKISSNANNNGADNVEAEVESVQIAYSMGGASIRLAQANGDNLKYQTGAAYDRDATTLSVSLAF